jgi:hypothetical protein
MGNNNIKTTNDVLVKVDQNNLIYLDPNSVLVNGAAEPRAIQPENLVMYVNLEADLIPRSILVTSDNKNTLLTIAKGRLNFLQNKDGSDYDTRWSNSFTDVKARSENDSFFQNDETGQSFGIENISIQVTGANFIPKVTIKFIDVRGKTLFESPENSPYSAFFHLPWPIFYLTVKGYYGKAIKYRLHQVKFNSKYNSSNGNFEVQCDYVGSTYAYLADISLESVLNAPYFYASENVLSTEENTGTGVITKTISKTTKGYRVLKSVYQEYINKGLLPKDFPVKTLREVIVLAGRLNKILERQIFEKVVNHNILAGVKSYEDTLNSFEQGVLSWKSTKLSPVYFTDPANSNTRWFQLSSIEKSKLDSIIGPSKQTTLQQLIANFVETLEKNEAFGVRRTLKFSATDKIKTKVISCTALKNINIFYRISDGKVGVDIDGILDRIYDIQKDFVEQRNKMESDIEKEMNDIVRSDKTIGLGFEPTVRNIIGVVLANAETFIRLMKDVHYKAFENAKARKEILSNVLTDADKKGDAIYPWPEVKAQTAGGKEMVLLYPGGRELSAKLRTEDKNLWPEVDFVENFVDIATKKADNLSGKEGNTDNINYVFDSTTSTSKMDISMLTNIINYVPYSDKSISSILYELYERAKYSTSLTPFDNQSMTELANIEYKNLKEQVIDDIDVVDMLKSNINNYSALIEQMQGSSPFERYPYYEDQLPTISYIKDGLAQDFTVEKYTGKRNSNISNNDQYTKVAEFLGNYKPESYRNSIYPFNSSTYVSYLGGKVNLNLNRMLFLNTPQDFISSPAYPSMWVKDEYRTNLFNNTIKIDDEYKHILNTPYFHKQLYDDFTRVSSQGKYAGSAYLFLNSLPFKDLDDTVNNTLLQITTKGLSGNDSTTVSTVFKEIGATHYIPYHMMLKWGSIYHRYKKWITENVDIIDGVTTAIDGDLYFDNYSGRTYTPITGITVNRSTESDIGFHPYYDTAFHQIVNGYGFFEQYLPSTGGTDSYTNTVTDGVNKLFYQYANAASAWTSFIDNSKFYDTDKRYTLLPCNGYSTVDGTDFTLAEQENFRLIWGIGVSDRALLSYDAYTLPSYGEYFKTTGSTETYSLNDNYRKVIDLIATFKPDILETFELAFLDFASEKLNEEISFNPYGMKYGKFQDLLKKVASVSKKDNDPTDTHGLILTVKQRQISELEELTGELLSADNLIRFSMGNPREVDNYVLGGFTDVNVKHFTVAEYSGADPDLIELYLGKDIDGYYEDFFVVNNIAETEENIKQFRPLVYIYAGQRATGIPISGLTKSDFITYLKTNIVLPVKTVETGVSGQDDRLNRFLNQVIVHIQSSDFSVKSPNQSAFVKRGYNDDIPKLELYNYFKSFNDKWTAGNSIGQRTLMEEFLFLDKANRDIGSSVYLDMEKLIPIMNAGNEKINLYSLIGMLVQDTGFEVRALPAYVNFYGNNLSNTKKITPSKNIAQSMFGSFLEVDYQESSPKIILQYIGPTSKHLELSDINKKYKFKDDGFDIGDVNKNPIIISPDVFSKTDFSQSNKVVAFEVSFGDQNQSIFKSVELDQSSIKNTSESFGVYERLGRSETGASTAQVDIGLFDIYRSSSYQCSVTAMGNVMIQPTMYFYLKNIPIFKGSYWITEVTHDIKTSGIQTTFKGTRIPQQSLPNPTDSFFSSYRSLFDKLVKRSVVKIKEEELLRQQQLSGSTATQKTIISPSGKSSSYDMGNRVINGETIIPRSGITPYGIPYNGFNGEEYIQLVSNSNLPTGIPYMTNEWLRAIAVQMGGAHHQIGDDVVMSILTKNTVYGEQRKIVWKDINTFPVIEDFYATRFDLDYTNAGVIISKCSSTLFLNPNEKSKNRNKVVSVETYVNYNTNTFRGPVSVGPVGVLTSDYVPGIALSRSLMAKLDLYDGQVVYFKLQP